MSRGLLRRCYLAGQGGAQAVSSWAFCLQGHRVGLSVGVMGSPPRHQCSKLMSRDVGLIGLLRYLPLAQFTKARPVDSLGPFSLAFPRNRYCHGSKAASDPYLCCAYDDKAMKDSSPCATLRVPQALGGY